VRALKSQVVFAFNEKDGYYNHGSEVEFQIDREMADSYVEAARAKFCHAVRQSVL